MHWIDLPADLDPVSKGASVRLDFILWGVIKTDMHAKSKW